MNNSPSRRHIAVATLLLLAFLSSSCAKQTAESPVGLAFRASAELHLPEGIAWEGHSESRGVDKTSVMPGLRPAYLDYGQSQLVYWYDLWKQPRTGRSGNAYGWALVTDESDIFIVELSICTVDGEVLAVDLWDTIFRE